MTNRSLLEEVLDYWLSEKLDGNNWQRLLGKIDAHINKKALTKKRGPYKKRKS